MLRRISSIGLVLFVFIVVLVSGCISDDVKETESNGIKHFEGKGISFNAPNTWSLGQMENWKLSDYLFSIGRGTGENLDLIHFHAGTYNRTLSDYINSEHENILRENFTLISEKELTVDDLPAYQITTVNKENKTITSTCFVKNKIMYAIYAVPSPGKNITSIEQDLGMVLNTFCTL